MQDEPSQSYPAAPEPGASPMLRCEHCERILGRVQALGGVEIRHAGRTVVVGSMAGLLAIECEGCKKISRYTDVKRFLAARTVELDAPTSVALERRGKAN